MDFQLPELTPFDVFFDASEPNSALPPSLVRFAGNIGFPSPPEERPWVYANFVQSLDGLVSFGGDRPGGEWISQSRHDRWMMDLLRAHADALICGAETLRAEAQFGKIPGGPVFRIVDRGLLRLREQSLGRAKLKNIIVTGSGRLPVSDYRVFRSEQVDSLIATTPEGRRALGDAGKLPVLVTGQNNRVNFSQLLRELRMQHGVSYLLCEGGPHLYGSLARQDLIDEKFLTISPQEIGADRRPASADPRAAGEIRQRPTSFGGPGLTIETARWYQWISSRRAGHHQFNRYRIDRHRMPGPFGSASE